MDVSYRGDADANNIQIMRSRMTLELGQGEDRLLQLLATFGVVVHLDDPDPTPTGCRC